VRSIHLWLPLRRSGHLVCTTRGLLVVAEAIAQYIVYVLIRQHNSPISPYYGRYCSINVFLRPPPPAPSLGITDRSASSNCRPLVLCFMRIRSRTNGRWCCILVFCSGPKTVGRLPQHAFILCGPMHSDCDLIPPQGGSTEHVCVISFTG
jgi:hypothetical protein